MAPGRPAGQAGRAFAAHLGQAIGALQSYVAIPFREGQFNAAAPRRGALAQGLAALRYSAQQLRLAALAASGVPPLRRLELPLVGLAAGLEPLASSLARGVATVSLVAASRPGAPASSLPPGRWASRFAPRWPRCPLSADPPGPSAEVPASGP